MFFIEITNSGSNVFYHHIIFFISLMWDKTFNKEVGITKLNGGSLNNNFEKF